MVTFSEENLNKLKIANRVELFLGFISTFGATVLLGWSGYRMTQEPYGVTSILPNQSYHSYTIFTLAVFFIFTYRCLLSWMPPIRHFFVSVVLTLFPLFHYEFWFHLGMWLTYGDYKPLFWGLYSLVIFVGIYYLHTRWRFLRLGKMEGGVFSSLYAIFLLLWRRLFITDFYVKFVQYYQGLIVENPIGRLVATGKIFGILMWMILVRRIENNGRK